MKHQAGDCTNAIEEHVESGCFEDDTNEREQLLKQPCENWRGFGEPKNDIEKENTGTKKRNYRASSSILNPQVNCFPVC